MKQILTVVGARPQFIKASVLSRLIKNGTPDLQEFIVHTGQHFDPAMSQIFFNEMRIPTPSLQLEINSMSNGAMTGRMLEALEQAMLDLHPDLVLVYGDTNSTLAGALAAAKLNIPVAHVEAGLRSGNMKMPEEVNRILTDHVSSLLFCPSTQASEMLKLEGLQKGVHVVGDIMLDAANFFSKNTRPSKLIKGKLAGKRFVLATVHRAENADSPEQLSGIVNALIEIGATHDLEVVVPLHPRTKKSIELFGISMNGLTVLQPVGYFDMLALLRKSDAVLTDSGGLQKEAYFFDKPCVVLRNETEWVELISTGRHTLSGSSQERIVKAFETVVRASTGVNTGLYGQGDAGERIMEKMVNFLS